jgi:transposase
MGKHKEKIFELRQEGKSYREIQKILGCSKGTISYHLGTEQKEKHGRRRRNSREEFKKELARIKESSGCVDCNKKFPHYVLEFDHVPERGEKINGVYKVGVIKGFAEAMKEIEKCDIVCANCHKTRTYKRKPW